MAVLCRKSLEGGKAGKKGSNRGWLVVLLVVGVGVLAVASWRQRSRGGRRMVSA